MPGSVPLFTPEFMKSPPDLPPGPVTPIAETVVLPADLPPGLYTLAVGVVDESQRPVIRLAIRGRDAQGWYPLSRIEIHH